mgnify:CR=1 FL=1
MHDEKQTGHSGFNKGYGGRSKSKSSSPSTGGENSSSSPAKMGVNIGKDSQYGRKKKKGSY